MSIIKELKSFTNFLGFLSLQLGRLKAIKQKKEEYKQETLVRGDRIKRKKLTMSNFVMKIKHPLY